MTTPVSASATTATNDKEKKLILNNKALAKAVALLDEIDFLDPVKPREDFHETIANAKRHHIGNLVNNDITGDLTAKETMTITMGAMHLAFGQWPDNDDKPDMSEAASEYAKEVVAIAAQAKAEEPTLFNAVAFAELMDEQDCD
jgi:hypothetical protein